MSQNVALAYGDPAIEPFFDSTQEMLSGAAPQLRLRITSDTQITLDAGTGDAQASVSIMGRYRYRTTSTSTTHPGGALVGSVEDIYDLYVTGTDNAFTPPNTDATDYSFTLVIRASGSPPASGIYRKVAEVLWNGSRITGLRMLAGQAQDHLPILPAAPAVNQSAIRARRFSSGQTAPVIAVESELGAVLSSLNGAGGASFSANVAISAGGLTITAGGAAITGNSTVTGTLTATAGMTVDPGSGTSNSVLTITGRNAGAANTNTITGLSAGGLAYNAATAGTQHSFQIAGTGYATVDTSGLNLATGGTYRIGGTQIAASNLSNGVTGSGAVVLATTPTITTPTINGPRIGNNDAALLTNLSNPVIYSTNGTGSYPFQSTDVGNLIIQGRSDSTGRDILFYTGATTPTERVRIDRNGLTTIQSLRVPTTSALGSHGTITTDTALHIQQQSTATTGTVQGIYSRAWGTNSAASTASVHGVNAQALVDSGVTGAVGTYYGGSFNVSHNAATVTLTAAYGTSAQVDKAGTGAVTTAYGVYANVRNTNATGAITTAYGVYIDSFTATGTITNRWGVYQAGASEVNHLLGDTRLGATAALTNGGKLQVTGDVNLTGIIRFSGTQISTTNLSDGANIIFTGSNQTFTGVKTFQAGPVIDPGSGGGTASGTLTLYGRNAGAQSTPVTVAASSAGDWTTNVGTGRSYIFQINATTEVTFDATGINLASGSTYRINGAQIAAADLSDGTNIAHINVAETVTANWTFSGAPVFSGAVSFTGTAANSAVGITQTAGDNSTRLATTAFVTAAVTAAQPTGVGYLANTQTWTGINTFQNGQALITRTGGATINGVALAIGRTATDATLNAVGVAGSYSSSAVVGDVVFRHETLASGLHFQTGSGAAAISIVNNLVTIRGNVAMASSQLSDAADIAHINVAETVTQAWTFTTNGLTSQGNITAKASGANASVSLVQGTTGNTGYIQFHNTSSVRLGYIGFDNTNLTLQVENGAALAITSGAIAGRTTEQSILTVSTATAPTFGATAPATQRFTVFNTPGTPTATAAQTITTVATVAIAGAVPTGTSGNVTVTNSYSLWVQGGDALFASALRVDGHITTRTRARVGIAGSNGGVGVIEMNDRVSISNGHAYGSFPDPGAGGLYVNGTTQLATGTIHTLTATLGINQTAATITAERMLASFNNINHVIGATFATQRVNHFAQPTYTGDAAGRVITDAATVSIGGAPVASGGNLAITNSYALWVQGGASRFQGKVNIDGGASTFVFGVKVTGDANDRFNIMTSGALNWSTAAGSTLGSIESSTDASLGANGGIIVGAPGASSRGTRIGGRADSLLGFFDGTARVRNSTAFVNTAGVSTSTYTLPVGYSMADIAAVLMTVVKHLGSTSGYGLLSASF